MYFPDDRCCDRSGADGGAFGPIDSTRDERFDAEALPPLFPEGLSGSQPCGGFLHPAAALLQRVLRYRGHEAPPQLAIG
jgi:hypothetical protein